MSTLKSAYISTLRGALVALVLHAAAMMIYHQSTLLLCLFYKQKRAELNSKIRTFKYGRLLNFYAKTTELKLYRNIQFM